MPCYHPLTAWRGPVLPSGKRSVVFSPRESTPGVLPCRLPCGQCIGCRLDYSLDWATRLMHENQMHDVSAFITVTYDDAHLPAGRSLVKRDAQLFMKRLRKEISPCRIKFFMAGEYGEKYGRPHYHALIFGFGFPDRVALKVTQSGSMIYSSEMLSRVWSKGFASVGDVTFESAAYVARYCLKKINGKGKEIASGRYELKPYERVLETGEVVDVLPEFVTMSRGGRSGKGIGYSWYQKFRSDVFPHDYAMVRSGAKMPPPRYYDGLYELENPVDMARIKNVRCSRNTRRETVWNDMLQKYQVLDVNRSDRLAVMELCKQAKVDQLRRRVDNE